MPGRPWRGGRRGDLARWHRPGVAGGLDDVGREAAPSVGSVPMVMRPCSRRTGTDSSRVTTAGSSKRSSSGCSNTGDRPVMSSRPSDDSAPKPSRELGDWPENDDQTSRSSVGSPVGLGVRTRGISPVGGSVQCGSGPVSESPNEMPPDPESVAASSPNSGGPKSVSSSRRLRQESSVIAESLPRICSIRLRAALALCARGPCRSARRGRA